jgi:hypothetical protein
MRWVWGLAGFNNSLHGKQDKPKIYIRKYTIGICPGKGANASRNGNGTWMQNIAQSWPGVVLTTQWGVLKLKQEWLEAEEAKIDLILKKAAGRFYKKLNQYLNRV